MSEQNNRPECFREAVCVEAQRIFDSCSDKDCLQDLPVTLDSGYSIGENVTIVKSKCVEVSDVCINVEAVPFNKGFYSVDITYTFRLTLDTYEKACTIPVTVKGSAIFTKRVILYGSEGNTKTFCSNGEKYGSTSCCCEVYNLPKVCCQVVDPIVLECRLKTHHCCDSSDCCSCATTKKPFIVVTLGLFSIIQMSRPVAVVVPVYDYCIPHKECTTSSDSPCELFEKIKFPTEEFFPPALEDCGCKE